MSNLARQLPPLSTLVVFEAACRLKSFSRAADECALSQASVSRQMRQLEGNLKLQLFKRHRYDVSPTKAGERLYTSVQGSLHELAATATELRDSEQSKNSFTIYADLSISTCILAPLIGRLHARFPGVKFNILSNYEPIEQTRSSFDVGFQPGRRAEDFFQVETIADDLVFPVCSPQFAKKFKSVNTIAELSKLPLLHLEYANNYGIDWRHFFKHHNFQMSEEIAQLVFSSYQISLDVAEQGEGIALGWARSVSSQLAEKKLVRFTKLSLPVTDGIAVYWRKHGDPHPLTSAFVDEVRSSLKPIGN